MDPKAHPAWEVYDSLRTARFGSAYYIAMLSPVQQKNQWTEILLAIAVPGSAVTALPMWTTNYGSLAWAILVSVCAFVCVAKPFLGWADAIQRYEATVTRYRMVESELAEIRSLIAQQRTYDSELRARFAVAQRGLLRAQELEPREVQNPKIQDRIFELVNREFPKDSFFVPSQ